MTLPPPLFPLQMKILSWNCRGASRPEFITTARELIIRHNPQVLIIMEAKLSFDRATDIANGLLFEDKIIVSTVNHAGGLWVLWNNSNITLSQVHISNRGVHAMISYNNGASPFLMSAIYNYPLPHLQVQVWDELNKIANFFNGCWLVIGDFNNILNESEKKGGIKPNLTKMLKSRDCIYQCGLWI